MANHVDPGRRERIEWLPKKLQSTTKRVSGTAPDFPCQIQCAGKLPPEILAVNYVGDVWLNGTYLGWHEGGYTPFAFEVTSALRFDSVNVLAVRVDNVPWSQGQVQDLPTGKRIDMCHTTRLTGSTIPASCTMSTLSSRILFRSPGSMSCRRISMERSRRQLLSRTRERQARQSIYRSRFTEPWLIPTNVNTEYSYELIGNPATTGGTTQTSMTVDKDTSRIWQTVLTVASPKCGVAQSESLHYESNTLEGRHPP